MGKKFSKEEMKEILKKDVKIPEIVDKKMQDAYQKIGLENIVLMKPKKKRNSKKIWKVAAAAAILTIGTSAGVLAASYFLSVNRVHKDGTMVYEIQIDREKEAHKIEVIPTYMPEGYVYHQEGPHGGKWRNEKENTGISIISYNAAELDRMARVGTNIEFMNYKKNTTLEEMVIDDQKVDVYTGGEIYSDSDQTAKNLYLFNELEGYGIWISSDGNFSAEEMVKIAEGLKVKILPETIAYATEDEIAKDKEFYEIAKDKQSEIDSSFGREIPDDTIYQIGEELSNPAYDPKYQDDIRYTVKSAEIKDAISFDEFPVENFVSDVSSWMNSDGTMKPHDRIKNGEDIQDAKSIGTKYLVVNMNIKNTSDTTKNKAEGGAVVGVDLTTVTKDEKGKYHTANTMYSTTNKGYELQYESNNGASFPVYIDPLFYTEGIQRLKQSHFRPMKAGESLDYTLIYVVDEDQIENLALTFYPNGVTEENNQYVILADIK